MNAPVKPLGYNVLVELITPQVKSTGGIILASETEQKRERLGRDIARVIAFGPTAFKGYKGCDEPSDWGVCIGDVVELSTRYDGKLTRAGDYKDEFKNYRYVSDQDLVGLAQGEFLKMIEEA